MSNDLIDNYSGKRADVYDQRRTSTRRWRNEVAAMAKFLDVIQPKVILDCPFGTGRWIEMYHSLGAQVRAVDLSADMLRRAREKIAELPVEGQVRFDVGEGSIFDLAPDPDGPPDVTVCVRFLNWVTWQDAVRSLDVLAAQGAEHMIVGVSIVPASFGPIRQAYYKWKLARANAKDATRPQQYVHQENDVVAHFEGLGLRIEAREYVMTKYGRVNYFYHLKVA